MQQERPRQRLVRHARTRLKLRRAWANLLLDGADQLLDGLEREAGPGAVYSSGGMGRGQATQGLRQRWRSEVLNQLADRIRELGEEGERPAVGRAHARVKGTPEALADYDT